MEALYEMIFASAVTVNHDGDIINGGGDVLVKTPALAPSTQMAVASRPSRPKGRTMFRVSPALTMTKMACRLTSLMSLNWVGALPKIQTLRLWEPSLHGHQ